MSYLLPSSEKRSSVGKILEKKEPLKRASAKEFPEKRTRKKRFVLKECQKNRSREVKQFFTFLSVDLTFSRGHFFRGFFFKRPLLRNFFPGLLFPGFFFSRIFFPGTIFPEFPFPGTFLRRLFFEDFYRGPFFRRLFPGSFFQGLIQGTALPWTVSNGLFFCRFFSEDLFLGTFIQVLFFPEIFIQRTICPRISFLGFRYHTCYCRTCRCRCCSSCQNPVDYLKAILTLVNAFDVFPTKVRQTLHNDEAYQWRSSDARAHRKRIVKHITCESCPWNARNSTTISKAMGRGEGCTYASCTTCINDYNWNHSQSPSQHREFKKKGTRTGDSTSPLAIWEHPVQGYCWVVTHTAKCNLLWYVPTIHQFTVNGNQQPTPRDALACTTRSITIDNEAIGIIIGYVEKFILTSFWYIPSLNMSIFSFCLPGI